MKAKKFIPAAHYKVAGDLVDKTHKSNLEKAPRKTRADEIAAREKKFKNPGPNVFNPNHDQVHRRLASCLNFKGERVSFIADA